MACVGVAVASMSMKSRADEGPRSLIQFAAVHSQYSLSVPWDMAKPTVKILFKLPNRTTGLALFRGHVKDIGDAGKDVVGGDLLLQIHRKKRVFPDIWKERLAEVGTVQMPGSGGQELYFVSMEGTNFQTWHFNLFNPVTSALISVSYGWGQDDKVANRKTSDNFKSPELADERDLLEKLPHDPDYGIPFN